jgi:hypothetical protein
MYVELHSRSAFSFLEGASIPEELIAMCANLGMPAMALLDRDGVYGAPRFHLAAKKAGIKAHIGAEVTCAIVWWGQSFRADGVARISTRVRSSHDESASAAGCFARWLSKSLPPDYENEIARWAQRRSLCGGSGFY